MLKNNLIFTISGKEIQPNRPEPILMNLDVVAYNRRMHPQEGVDALLEGYHVLIVDFYSSGLAVLNELKNRLNHDQTTTAKEPGQTESANQSFQQQREFRSKFRELSHRLLLVVSKHKLSVKKAPEIGWLKILYPDLEEFLLPFPQVQGLNSAWQWYKKGLSIPVLDREIHPWFGTYFPTRFEHLKLFNTWLKQYRGEKKSAFDIGIGSGVLSFLLEKQGFEKIIGTDSNPNAIIGLSEELNKNEKDSKIELIHGDLFADSTQKSELIVFNPPWIPASYDLEGIDKAIYYDETLFPRFFAEAEKHLQAQGRLVLLFSNLAQISKITKDHPIEAELAKGGRFQKEFFIQKKVGAASKKTKRNQSWRDTEMVELWVLKKGE